MNAADLLDVAVNDHHFFFFLGKPVGKMKSTSPAPIMMMLICSFFLGEDAYALERDKLKNHILSRIRCQGQN